VVVQGHALVALARIGGADASGVLLRFVRATRTDAVRLQAALAGRGLLAARLPPLARTAVAGEVAAHADRGNPDTVGMALLTLGRLFAVATGGGRPHHPRHARGATAAAADRRRSRRRAERGRSCDGLSPCGPTAPPPIGRAWRSAARRSPR
jgi:hypothetical protein